MDYTVENIVISADHPCFEGHFPGHPIFPAVAQIDLVVDQLQKIEGRELTVLAIRKAKFPAPLLPDTCVQISLKIEEAQVHWKIFGNDRIYSQGLLEVTLFDSIDCRF